MWLIDLLTITMTVTPATTLTNLPRLHRRHISTLYWAVKQIALYVYLFQNV